METRSLTTVFDEQGKPLLSFYRQMDGYFEGHGQELQDFLFEFKVCRDRHRHFGRLGDDNKVANGMSCLAAQLIAHFKTGIGNIYIYPHSAKQEYNYEIRHVSTSGRYARVSLVGNCAYEGTKSFKLYSDDLVGVPILKRVEFVYDKHDGDGAKWRMVDVTDEDGTYLSGFEGGKYKRFLKSRIVGQRVLTK
jgi:hypothetical protein